jgi:hypothetical protein
MRGCGTELYGSGYGSVADSRDLRVPYEEANALSSYDTISFTKRILAHGDEAIKQAKAGSLLVLEWTHFCHIEHSTKIITQILYFSFSCYVTTVGCMDYTIHSSILPTVVTVSNKGTSRTQYEVKIQYF